MKALVKTAAISVDTYDTRNAALGQASADVHAAEAHAWRALLGLLPEVVVVGHLQAAFVVGMAVGSVFTLYVIPAFYMLIARDRAKARATSAATVPVGGALANLLNIEFYGWLGNLIVASVGEIDQTLLLIAISVYPGLYAIWLAMTDASLLRRGAVGSIGAAPTPSPTASASPSTSRSGRR